MKADFHLHTDYSYDSSLTGTALARKALKLGYKTLAITEHLDLLPQELTVFGLPSLTSYHDNLRALRIQYPQLNILFGIEIGDYHRVKTIADSIVEVMQFDLILGSVHFVDTHLNIAIPFQPCLSPAQIRDYYRQNLQMVESCNINVLAHLGVYKRYYQKAPDETHCNDLIDEIFRTMIAKGIALEINYSSFRKIYPSLLPELFHLQRYRDLGGRLVTIGSDSHHLNHFDDYYRQAAQAVSECGFELLNVYPR